MSKILLQKTERGLIPVYDSDKEEYDKLKLDEIYSFDVKKERNYQFHKKFMALCKLGSENSKTVEMPFDSYRKYITMKAGFYNTYKTPKGIYFEAESISFGNMDEDKFREVYSRVLDQVIIDTQADKETIERELLSFL